MNIQENTIVTGFDGKNFWPKKILKVTKTRATVIDCTQDGRELGEPVTKKIDHHSGKPTMQFHPCEIVYLTEIYDNKQYMANSDI